MNWKAPEFTFFEKGTVWYTASIVLALLIVLFAILQGNILFAIFAVLAEILVLYWARQEPPLVEYAFGERGLLIGQEFIPMKNLSGFAFVTDHPDDPYYELVFSQAGKLAPFIKILVPSEDVDELFEIVNQFLEEIEYQESLAEHIMKIIRF